MQKCLKSSIFTFFFWKEWYSFSHWDAFSLHVSHSCSVLTDLKQSLSSKQKQASTTTTKLLYHFPGVLKALVYVEL